MKTEQEDNDILELIKKIVNLSDTQNNYLIQSGTFGKSEGDINPFELNQLPLVDNSEDEHAYPVRVHEEKIIFPRPFNKAPDVHLGISHLETNASEANVRAGVKAHKEDISTNGFTMVFYTWADTKVFEFEVNWLAYTI